MLRGLLLGAGNIGLQGHAPQWAWALNDRVEIVGVADLSPANRESAQALFPRATLYKTAQEALADEAPDFVDICTPPFTHRTLIEAAAGRGIHIVCEKPLAPSFAEALRCKRAITDAGIVFQPCHQYNYSPSWRVVRDLVKQLGAIHFGEYSVRRTSANEGSSNWTPDWRTRPDLAGGGILTDHGSHVLYQLRSLMGEPRAVSATVRTLLHREYGVEDTALLTLDHGTALAQVSLTWAARRREIAFRFVGECGELFGNEEAVQLHTATTKSIALAGLSGNSSHSAWFAPMFSDFINRVERHDRDSAALDEAVFVARVIECAYISSTSGRAVVLDGGWAM